MLGGATRRGSEKPDAEIGQLATRRDVGFVPDEHVPGIWIAAERPPVSVWAAVKLSFFHWLCRPLPSPKKSPDYGRLAVCDRLGSLSGLRLSETPTTNRRSARFSFPPTPPRSGVETLPAETALTGSVARRHQIRQCGRGPVIMSVLAPAATAC
jgi:hypothetical protein